jgi:hypothetical protein
MFEALRRNRLEKEFPNLKLVWESNYLEVTPWWGDYDYQTRFKIYTGFLNRGDLKSLLKILAKVFAAHWYLKEKGYIPIVELNDSTLDNSKFIRELLRTDLSMKLKLLLIISGKFSVKHLGLEETLELLNAKKEFYAGTEPAIRLGMNCDLVNKALFIFPGVGYDFDFHRPVLTEEIEHFFTSEGGLELALFLAHTEDSDVTFGHFREMAFGVRDISNKRQFCTADLLIALDIVENSSLESLNKLTAEQLLSLAREIQPGQAASYPMEVILKRPRISNSTIKLSSKIVCLDILTEFITSEELEILESEVRAANFVLRLSRIALFEAHGVADPMGRVKSTAPILSVLAEIAVTKGVHVYCEVIDILESIFTIRHYNWETREPDVRVNLVNLLFAIVDKENDGINFRWILELNGYLPLDLGRNCMYRKGEIIFV